MKNKEFVTSEVAFKGFIISHDSVVVGYRENVVSRCFNTAAEALSISSQQTVYEVIYNTYTFYNETDKVITDYEVVGKYDPKSQYKTGFINLPSSTYEGVLEECTVHKLFDTPEIVSGCDTFRVQYDDNQVVILGDERLTDKVIIRGIVHIDSRESYQIG